MLQISTPTPSHQSRPRPQLHWVPPLGDEARVRKGSGASAGSSRHRELKRTMKIAAGTVRGPSLAEKSTGLVQQEETGTGQKGAAQAPHGHDVMPYSINQGR